MAAVQSTHGRLVLHSRKANQILLNRSWTIYIYKEEEMIMGYVCKINNLVFSSLLFLLYTYVSF